MNPGFRYAHTGSGIAKCKRPESAAVVGLSLRETLPKVTSFPWLSKAPLPSACAAGCVQFQVKFVPLGPPPISSSKRTMASQLFEAFGTWVSVIFPRAAMTSTFTSDAPDSKGGVKGV